VRSRKISTHSCEARPSGRFRDETRFIKTLLENPRLTGAVAPSGPHLARAMARAVGQVQRGLVIELGPGTGPVTTALIEQGVAEERLVLVEYDAGFCRLLAQRFPSARVLQGDAYDLPRTLADCAGQPIAAIVSSLPLLNQPPMLRIKLLADAFALMGPAGVFVQFTYGLQSPVPREACANRVAAAVGPAIWRNLPPARVWTYRFDPDAIHAEALMARLRDGADWIGERWAAHRRNAKIEAARRRGERPGAR
jgi:phosphatidylethanolamine/phosphatidyl-N-methylethanolamine N-methyltransferase